MVVQVEVLRRPKVVESVPSVGVKTAEPEPAAVMTTVGSVVAV